MRPAVLLRRIRLEARRRERWAERYVTSFAHTVGRRNLYGDVERFCLFVGYPRSGHSLIGSLLNAHHEVVIAHEMDAHKYIMRGFNRDQLYWHVLRQDERF